MSESNGGMGIADESIGYDPNNSVFEADLGGHYNNVPNSMINNATPVNTNNPVVMMQMTTPLPQSSGQGDGNYNNGAPRAAFEEEEQRQIRLMQHGVGDQPPIMQRPKSSMSGQQSRGVPGVHWRDPDLHEVIEFLQNPNSVIKANAAAYLQHLCYMDDPVKAKTRQLGGIPPLVGLLSHEIPEIHRNACGALRNLSYGRQNDENKRAIKNAGGITALVRLLRKTTDNEVKELVTGVLWNLSSCDDLKRAIIDEALLVLINIVRNPIVIIPHSGWDPNGQGSGGETHWTTVFRNSSGILRNISSAGDYGRKKLRECEGLVDSVLYLVKKAIEKANIDNKSVENCVCVLRNLSYRAQEVDDPNYDKHMGLPPGETRAGAKPHSDNLGCFGASSSSKNTGSGKGGSSGRKDSQATSNNHGPGSSSRPTRTGPVKGMELLWQPEVVQPYLNLLSNCSNPETLEAAAGAIQNLSACYWQASIDVRAAVRKEKGLPILVELLRMEVDRVVCAVATALRNLAIDQRNKELVGKYAMRDLVQKLPSVSPQHDHGTSDDTIAAVLATLNEVIKKHPEFSRSLLEAGGVDRLMTITRQRQRFTPRVVKFASQVLYSMWVHQDLRETYRKAGWKEADFVTKTVAARNARPNSPTNLNSTLNRPMASQSGTRYEDRTMQRPGGTGGQTSSSGSSHHHMNNSGGGYSVRPEEVPMENLSLYSGGQQRNYAPNHIDISHQSQTHQQMLQQQQHHQQQLANAGYNPVSNYSDHADHWQVMAAQQVAGNGSANIVDGNVGSSAGQGGQAGDSWV